MLRMPFLLVIILYIFSNPPTSIAAQVEVIDGDTIKIDGINIRLFGIDAPELKQKCKDNKNIEWDCGKCAKAFLQGMLAISEVKCEAKGNDKYKRTVAICFVNGTDLNKEIVKAGYGIAYKQYSKKYAAEEVLAKTYKRGIWSGTFTTPGQYRKEKKNKTKSSLVKES